MNQPELITRKTALSGNIVSFCRYLRHAGFGIGPAEEVDALQAMSLLAFATSEQLQLTLRMVLCKSLKDLQRFDELYQQYWQELGRAVDSKINERTSEDSNPQPEQPTPNTPPSLQALKDWLHGRRSSEQEELSAYSGQVVLTRKDFSLLTDDELQEVMSLIGRMARSLATRLSRRYQGTHQRRQFDVRRTIRNSMRRGGEIVELAHRRKRIHKLKLLMLCDVSKSMDLYSRFLLHFIYAFQHVYKQIETFVFSTSLHHISEALAGGDFSRSLDRLSREIPDWSGGTRIGHSLQRFLRDHETEMLDRDTIVIIVSDGWDTGDIDLLSESMQRIHQRSGRVIWLNPLAGSSAYQPTVRGMQAALPYIDIFAPFHNLESLRGLLRYLRSSNHRTSRKHRRSFVEEPA